MITRFEKRIIAVLLAAFLCVPLSAFPAMPTQAEEADNTGQQQEQQSSDAQENESDQEMPDNDFIPIEEEPANEAVPGQTGTETDKTKENAANEENQGVTEQPQETAAPDTEVAERSPNAGIPDEELPVIEVPTNGASVRTTTNFAEDGYSVRYLFMPEVTGVYCLEISSGWFNIYEKAESGETFIEPYNWGDKIQLEQGKTYYIDISGYTGETSVEWTFSKVLDVTCGNYEAKIENPGDTIHYRLTYDDENTEGIYFFQADQQQDVDIIVYNVGSNSSNSYLYQKLDTTEECYIDISYRESSETGSIPWGVDSVETQTVNAGEEVQSTISHVEKNNVYKFVPEESGSYHLSSSTQSVSRYIYNSNWTMVVGAAEGMPLTEGETYYIVFSGYYKTESITWSINLMEKVAVEVDQIYTYDPEKPTTYLFTPETSGRYRINTGEFNANATVYTTDSAWVPMLADNSVQLTAGETYQIYINSYTNKKVEWKVQPKKEVKVQSGELYRLTADDAVDYKFVPAETGEYAANGMTIYDDAWNYVSSWGESVNLEAGQTYYLVPSYVGNRYWSIDKTEPQVEPAPSEVQADQTYTLEEGIDGRYTFTPEVSSRYHLWIEQTVSFSIMLDGEIYYSDYESDAWIYLEAGKTYDITIYSNYESMDWEIRKSSLESISAGTAYTKETDAEVEYQFIPDEEGNYMLTVDGIGECMVYDSNWSEIDQYTYTYLEKNTFGSNTQLKADETYYIHIQAEESADFQIEKVEEAEGFGYRVKNDGSLELLSYIGDESKVEIPENIDGKEVSSVGYGVFADNRKLTSVTVPNTVTELQYGAFQSCSNLQSVEFAAGSKLQTIGINAFQQCINLSNINIPESVQEIKAYGFAGCWKLDVELPGELTEIGDSAFYNTNLTDIQIPDSVTEVGVGAFLDCESLEAVTLGKGMEGIPMQIFNGCEQLKEITFPENITYIGDSAFSGTGLTAVSVPESVTSIGNYAFSDCQNLQTASVSNKLTYIADGAFARCNLTEYTIGDQVQRIGRYAFTENNNLESITIPNSVTEIEYAAFEGCQNLLEIQFPDSLEKIENKAFDDTAWYEAQGDGPVYAADIFYKYKGDMPEGTSLKLEDGTKGIVGEAFYWQSGLTSIEIPQTVTYIGEEAFIGCDHLTAVTIPETVTEIGVHAFGYLDGSHKLEGFTISGVAGSAAQTYAEENGFEFVEIEPSYILGDVNGDGEAGKIDDLRLVLRKICGKVELTSIQMQAADVDKDNTADDPVDIKDLRKLLRYVCGKIDSFD